MSADAAPVRMLVVGDAYIPASAYLTAATELAGGSGLKVHNIDLPGTRSEQHAIQQGMERNGANSAPPVTGMLNAVAGVQVLGVHFAPVGADVIAAGERLKVIAVARAGLENIDIAAATARGIAVVPAFGRNAGAVAELQIGLMLAESRNIARADESVKTGEWRKDFSRTPSQLGGNTVGMVGFGHVGRAFAQRLAGFGCRLLAYDPLLPDAAFTEPVHRITDLTELFTISDFVVMQARLTADNERFIGQEQFAAMKPSAYFINAARSRLVDSDALYAALDEGRIAGAGLDVFDDEPMPTESRWRTLPNLTMTTHFAGDTTETITTSARMIMSAAAQFAASGQVSGAVNAMELTA